MAVSRGQLDLRHITAEREMTATKSGKDGKLTLHPSLHLSISFSRNELKRTSIRQPGKKEGLDKEECQRFVGSPFRDLVEKQVSHLNSYLLMIDFSSSSQNPKSVRMELLGLTFCSFSGGDNEVSGRD